MLVDSQKLKALPQQHLAEVCDLSMRTIQRVEKDGVASNETVSAYASIFELDVSELLISADRFEGRERTAAMPPLMIGVLILCSFAAGVGCTLWFL